MKHLSAIAFALLLSACPPGPVNPDGGSDGSMGTGGSPGVGGSVVVDAGPDVTPDASLPPESTCISPGTKCCRTCLVLAAHGCPEGKPTARGATCEERCQSAESGPAILRTPDVSGCADVACVRTTTKARHGIACKGGR
jgi:hypothetical protein